MSSCLHWIFYLQYINVTWLALLSLWHNPLLFHSSQSYSSRLSTSGRVIWSTESLIIKIHVSVIMSSCHIFLYVCNRLPWTTVTSLDIEDSCWLIIRGLLWVTSRVSGDSLALSSTFSRGQEQGPSGWSLFPKFQPISRRPYRVGSWFQGKMWL